MGEAAWQSKARCRTQPTHTDFFFPNPDAQDYQEQAKAAENFCLLCPVKQECRTLAELAGEENGVWGGVNFTTKPEPEEQAS